MLIEPGPIVVSGVKHSIEQAWAYRANQLGRIDAHAKEVDEAYQLALRLLASLLHETRANIERMRCLSETFHSEETKGQIALGVFDFSVSDALMPELCRVVPTPVLLERCRSIISAAKRADFYVRVAASGPTDRFGPAIGFADDAINKKVIDRFNSLVSFGHDLAGSVFAGDAKAEIAGLFPDRIDPSEPVRHDTI